MGGVHDIATGGFKTVELAVVVIDNDHGGTHAGVFFVADEQPRFMHLAFHKDLRVEGPPASGLFCDPDLPKQLRNHFLMLLEGVEDNNVDTINYAFGYDGTSRFSDTGVLQLGATQIGLTCATFVLAVFDSVGFPLVRPETWHQRDGDAAAIASLLGLIRKVAGDAYADKVAAQGNAHRFRPEDVLAAAATPQAPHELNAIAALSNALRSRVLGVPETG